MEPFKKVWYISGALIPTKHNPDLKENVERFAAKAVELLSLGIGAMTPIWLGDEIAKAEGITLEAVKASPELLEKWYEIIVEGNDFALQGRCDGTYFLNSAQKSRGGLKELKRADQLLAERDEYDIVHEGADNDPTLGLKD